MIFKKKKKKTWGVLKLYLLNNMCVCVRAYFMCYHDRFQRLQIGYASPQINKIIFIYKKMFFILFYLL